MIENKQDQINKESVASLRKVFGNGTIRTFITLGSLAGILKQVTGDIWVTSHFNRRNVGLVEFEQILKEVYFKLRRTEGGIKGSPFIEIYKIRNTAMYKLGMLDFLLFQKLFVIFNST